MYNFKTRIMKNLLDKVREATKANMTKERKSFNTNDWIDQNLENDKWYKRHDVINMLIVARLEHEGIDENAKDFDKHVQRLYKTSKNGLDTSVSDSNNNSSYNYNERYTKTLERRSGEIRIVK
jgi:hypothetical protein